MTGRRALAVIGSILFASGVIALFVVSRGKWSDAIVDSGREWIVPDALARGELLYRDVVYWFGPFTPYFHAFFFRLFGSSFSTLVLAGCFGAAGVLASLFFALRRVTDRSAAFLWTALAVPALVFMPNAGGAILGMGFRMWHAAGFGLLAVALAGRRRESGPPWWMFASGMAAGFAGLCRTEWGIAALVAACLTASLRVEQSEEALASPRLDRREGALARDLLSIVGFFGLVFGGGLGLFIALAGAQAVIRDAPVLLFNLPAQTRATVAAIHFSAWGRGAAQAIYGASVYVAAFLLIDALADPLARGAGRSRWLASVGGLFAVFAAAAWAGGFPSGPLFSGAPILCAGSILAGLWARRKPIGAPLAGFGTLGVLTSYRRPFFITDGPYVAPPLLFALVCAAACFELVRAGKPPSVGSRMSSRLAFALCLVIAAAFAGRLGQYGSDGRVPIPGTGGMLSARPEEARQIREVAARIRLEAGPGRGLVVFPEGEVLNFLTGQSNPLRDKLYLPGYIGPQNESRILEELSRARPSALVIWPRLVGEYGSGRFGQDYALAVGRWIESCYRPSPGSGWGPHGPRLFLPPDRLACSGPSNSK